MPHARALIDRLAAPHPAVVSDCLDALAGGMSVAEAFSTFGLL